VGRVGRGLGMATAAAILSISSCTHLPQHTLSLAMEGNDGSGRDVEQRGSVFVCVCVCVCVGGGSIKWMHKTTVVW
jgi:hypothetical protein